MSENILNIVNELILLPKETEWLEFKENNYGSQEFGEYISALSNSACLHNREKAYLIFGVKDGTHEVVGTNFNPKNEKVGNQELENWIATQLEPKIDFRIYELKINDFDIIAVEIDATNNTPVKFRGTDYIRVGSCKHVLNKFPEKARKIWQKDFRKVFEKEIAMEGINADEVIELLDYPGFFSLLKLKLPDNKIGILEKLESEKIIIKNREKYSITNLRGDFE